MQRDDILHFLEKIDAHLSKVIGNSLNGSKFELRIFGKSVLLLAGLKDTLGTTDIDLLRIEGRDVPGGQDEIIASLEAEFGVSRIKVHGYYLQFVSPAVVFQARAPIWVPIQGGYKSLAASYLDPNHVIASKLFSAFSSMPRKRDKQDAVAALDQNLVSISAVSEIADQIFDLYSMDSRSDRFPSVYEYLVEHLMADYGLAEIKYRPPEN